MKPESINVWLQNTSDTNLNKNTGNNSKLTQ